VKHLWGISPIEKQFEAYLGELADAIENEHGFGDKEKHGRLIIELDGHEYHSSKEQLKKDAFN
jgi:hypothetical protein